MRKQITILTVALFIMIFLVSCGNCHESGYTHINKSNLEDFENFVEDQRIDALLRDLEYVIAQLSDVISADLNIDILRVPDVLISAFITTNNDEELSDDVISIIYDIIYVSIVSNNLYDGFYVQIEIIQSTP
ncbi:MAG: hypothetical protein LBD23_00150 [Oscillospiraceae bacterium]|jgi:hypothetical protein|nr:hypothetical protein [Oscillospiraceae bacterium]